MSYAQPPWRPRSLKAEEETLALQKRMDQLTTKVENMQKVMDRFIALYESEKLQNLSQEQRSQGAEAVSDHEKSVKNNAEKQKLEELLRKVEKHEEEKQEWLSERGKLHREVNYCRLLLQKCQTYNSSTQAGPPDLQNAGSSWKRYSNYRSSAKDVVNNAEKIQSESAIKPFKCIGCGKSFGRRLSAIKHQDECVPKDSKYSCILCDQHFFQLDDLRNHIKFWHGASDNDMLTKYLSTESSPDKKIVDNKKFEKFEAYNELHSEPTVTKEEDKQQQEQKVEQAVEVDETAKALQDTLQISKKEDENPEINLSHPISKLLNPPSLAQNDEKSEANVSTPISLTFQARMKFHNNLMSVMDQHKCDNINCFIVGFKNSINHTIECESEAKCEMYICKQKQSRYEHLKVCGMKCSECRRHRHSVINEKNMLSLLEMDCTTIGFASARGDFLNSVIAFYVNYGFADISEENIKKEELLLTTAEKHIENHINNLSLSLDDEASGWDLLEFELQ